MKAYVQKGKYKVAKKKKKKGPPWWLKATQKRNKLQKLCNRLSWLEISISKSLHE
jgi:hypothetical protein